MVLGIIMVMLGKGSRKRSERKKEKPGKEEEEKDEEFDTMC